MRTRMGPRWRDTSSRRPNMPSRPGSGNGLSELNIETTVVLEFFKKC